MDKTNDKIVFLVVFIIPVIIVVILAWLLIGSRIVQSNVVFGYLNGISVMIIPTVIIIGLGLLVKHFFFK
jgi:hypothetical protein